jgi:hypothetical protein
VAWPGTSIALVVFFAALLGHMSVGLRDCSARLRQARRFALLAASIA